MPLSLKVNRRVKYRNASGRVRTARITAVTNATTLNLRVGIGPTKLAVTGAIKVNPHTTGAGWFRSGGS